jgi:hypothetical protein
VRVLARLTIRLSLFRTSGKFTGILAALLVIGTTFYGVTPALAQACVATTSVNMNGQTAGGGGVNFDVSANCAAIRSGLYQVSGSDTGNNYPVSGSGGLGSFAGDAGTFTTAKATYRVVIAGAGVNPATNYADGYTVSITSLVAGETGGADSFTMFYAAGTDAQNNVFGNATTPFTVNITNLVSNAPTVTAISPTSGPVAGGNSVVITGTNFTGTSGIGGVQFGGINATSYTINSDTQITAIAPNHAAGTVDVIVTNGTSSATSAADQYTYLAVPTVSSISPATGPAGGGTSVVITGTNLSGASAVSFGGTAATTFTVNSATQITATAPAHAAGTVDITVTTAGGTSATSAADQFTYVAAPTVT